MATALFLMAGGFDKKNLWLRALLCNLVACVFTLATAKGATVPSVKNLQISPSILPVAIFGKDERQDVPSQFSALEGKIGMLYEQSTQTLCTAFCVAKGVIATAAHCLFQPKNGRLPDLDEVTFSLTYGKTPRQTSGIAGRRSGYVKHNIAVGTTSFNNEPPLSAPRDWALVKLERPICRFGALEIADRSEMSLTDLKLKSEQNKFFQVAYHWDYKHWQLAYSTPCRIKKDFEKISWEFIRQHFVNDYELLLHDCDTGGASSGSPLLLDTRDSPESEPKAPVVVAMNVGTYTRTRILLRQGRIVKRLDPDIIANTGVIATSFKDVIPILDRDEIISSPEQMVRLQTELQLRGLYTGTIDGTLGRQTRDAIIRFENAHGMHPTGIPTQTVLQEVIGRDQIKPAHLVTTGTGVVNEEDITQATDVVPIAEQDEIIPPPIPGRRPSSIPKPTPKPTYKAPPFNPFGNL